MTREEAILQLEYRKDFATVSQKEALDMAIDTMRQYQKIIEIIGIVKDDSTYSGITRESIAFQDIAKVVENGNND